MFTKGIQIASFLGLTAIILGAFGAHALKQILTPEQLISFETGVRYQMYHALFLILIALLPNVSVKVKNTITWLVFLGVLLFSGSIYILALQAPLGINASFLGPVTPIGGLLLILSWLFLLLFSIKAKK